MSCTFLHPDIPTMVTVSSPLSILRVKIAHDSGKIVLTFLISFFVYQSCPLILVAWLAIVHPVISVYRSVRRSVYPMIYAFTYREFSPPPSPVPFKAEISALRLKSKSLVSNPYLEAQIQASKLRSQPQGSNSDIRAQVLTLTLKSRLRGSNSSHDAQMIQPKPPYSNTRQT